MDLIFLGLMAVLVVIGLVIGKLAGKKLGKAEFDERQQLARGKAYKASFYTLLAGFSAMETAGFADGITVENSMNFIIAVMGLIILTALAVRLRMAVRDEE